MSDNLKRMREAAAKKPQAAPKTSRNPIPPQGGSGTAPPQGKKSPETKPEKERVIVESISHACGHVVGAAMYSSQKCPACIAEFRKERLKRKAGKRAKLALQPHTECPERLQMNGNLPGRLPVGSEKHLVWNGQEWVGIMRVPGIPDLHATEKTEKHCYHALHAAYMAWKKANPETVPIPETKTEEG